MVFFYPVKDKSYVLSNRNLIKAKILLSGKGLKKRQQSLSPRGITSNQKHVQQMTCKVVKIIDQAINMIISSSHRRLRTHKCVVRAICHDFCSKRFWLPLTCVFDHQMCPWLMVVVISFT